MGERRLWQRAVQRTQRRHRHRSRWRCLRHRYGQPSHPEVQRRRRLHQQVGEKRLRQRQFHLPMASPPTPKATSTLPTLRTTGSRSSVPLASSSQVGAWTAIALRPQAQAADHPHYAAQGVFSPPAGSRKRCRARVMINSRWQDPRLRPLLSPRSQLAQGCDRADRSGPQGAARKRRVSAKLTIVNTRTRKREALPVVLGGDESCESGAEAGSECGWHGSENYWRLKVA